jgi:hypothetical protein
MVVGRRERGSARIRHQPIDADDEDAPAGHARLALPRDGFDFGLGCGVAPGCRTLTSPPGSARN